MKVIILGSGTMLMNLIAGCKDAKSSGVSCDIVGVFRYDKVRYKSIDRFFVDLFNPTQEYSYIKSLGLYEIQARSANSAEFKKEVMRLNADIVLVGTWGEKIKKPIINLPKLATINVHPSLLPKYRGPNPYLEAIRHMEKESGVTFHLMDENFDTGAILHQKKVDILPMDTGEELRQKITSKAREGVCELVKKLEEEIIIPINQDEKVASYFPQIKNDDVMLDFSKSAQEILAQIIAFHPWTKCYYAYKNKFFTPDPRKLEIVDNKLSLVSSELGTQNPSTILQFDFSTDCGRIVEKSHKDKSITVLCADGKCLKMSGIALYGPFGRLITRFYIKYFVK